MARGLSDLQKAILLLAVTKAGQPTPAGVDRWEILAAHYGWHAVPRTARYTTLRFNRTAVGLNKYLARQVAVTRALQRLRRRGLIKPFPSARGITVTDAGAALARVLTKAIG